MKSIKIQILEKVLRFMAKMVLNKYHPKIVGITGSVGKTSAKEAIFSVINGKFKVRKNEKNYNNEIGIPLTVIGVETGGRSLSKWFSIFLHWIDLLIFQREYPEVLILEMGVDRPGDMGYLLSFIKPFVGVVTNISSSHIEFFKSLENIATEKGLLIEAIDKDGFAVLSSDDELVLKMSERAKSKTLTFGFSQNSIVNAEHAIYYYNGNIPAGLSFKLNHGKTNMPVRLNGVLAHHQINTALAGVAVGLAFKINLVDIAKTLETFAPATGRLNLIKGINNCYFIDDTYNASPTSTIAALTVLADIKAIRKIAVLGDMLELGMESEIGHNDVIKKVFDSNVDIFVGVGRRMKLAISELESLGFAKDKIMYFDNPDLAAEKIASFVREGDLILIKGSQGMRMEKISYEIIDDKQQAISLLCRQSQDWKKIPFGNP